MSWALEWFDRRRYQLGLEDEQQEAMMLLDVETVTSALIEEMRSPIDVYRDANGEQHET